MQNDAYTSSFSNINSQRDESVNRENQQQQVQKRVELEIVQERQDQFRQLEGDIVDLNYMFKDLALMVHDQGEILG